jgi:hypothetical protein
MRLSLSLWALQEQAAVFLDSGTDYEIENWTSSRVTAREQTPCATFLMTIDVQGEQVTIVTVPQPDLSTCKGFRPPERPSTWKLVDGLPKCSASSRLPAGEAAAANPIMRSRSELLGLKPFAKLGNDFGNRSDEGVKRWTKNFGVNTFGILLF